MKECLQKQEKKIKSSKKMGLANTAVKRGSSSIDKASLEYQEARKYDLRD